MIDLIAESVLMRDAAGVAARVAATDSTVLITGESGAGKDALARYIHARSDRSARPFITIDCSTLPGDLIEAELFGYERGAFTGATEPRPGRIEAAHKGTLVLDEIAFLSVEAQAKLLRLIERREFERLGGRRMLKVDARLITLTNADLDAAVRRRAFREDLFYRLNVIHIAVPPLRDRQEDIEPLARSFLRTYAAKHGRNVMAISDEALGALRAHDYPGNVRELANVIERAVIVARGELVGVRDLSGSLASAARGKSGRKPLARIEEEYILEVLAAARGNKAEAARVLGISRKNLYSRLARIEGRAG